GIVLQQVFGISPQAAELLYGVAGGVGGIAADAALARQAGTVLSSGKIAGELENSTPTLRQVNVTSGSKGNWNKELNKPQPNTIYTVDDVNVYQTDSLSRVTKVDSDLSLLTKDRNTYQQCKAGKCGNAGDDGGHLIASILNGPGEKLNIVPMDANLNRGVWKQMENSWANALKDGQQVKVTIEPIYSGNSVRPGSFNVTYTIDGGRPIRINFKNSPGG
ncbi:DNA/RNA non-specific endonuclease, partial [Ralstonia pseudosolanacearum]|uniref:DNA/RNA non-specific endonuclease n=1 Tax=Ralstonia pseudosolanacearum TaxID=1310165 RepID=UPI0026768232